MTTVRTADVTVDPRLEREIAEVEIAIEAVRAGVARTISLAGLTFAASVVGVIESSSDRAGRPGPGVVVELVRDPGGGPADIIVRAADRQSPAA